MKSAGGTATARGGLGYFIFSGREPGLNYQVKYSRPPSPEKSNNICVIVVQKIELYFLAIRP